jgi:hypothetical protein
MSFFCLLCSAEWCTETQSRERGRRGGGANCS